MEHEDLLNVAVRILMKRGQASSNHLEKVLLEEYPSAGAAAIARTIGEAREIIASCIALANRESREQMTRDEVMSTLERQWPNLTEDTLVSLYAFATYVAMR